MKYRRDIDGLRAVAVVPVILFHAGFDVFRGGFVGVDVFFVISGYLITSIILSERRTGSFSLASFYERRARRILPALFTVMLASIPFAWLWLLPNEMREFSKSLSYVSVFVSNILFFKQSGYFDTAAELKPLLHTWSLAVEEQFYIFFPLLLLALLRFTKRYTASTLLLIAAASLALAHWGAYSAPDAAFYLTPFRIWELLLGSIVALCRHSPNTSEPGTFSLTPTAQNVLSTAGFSAIVLATLSYSGSTPFPSLYTLVPTVGTAAVLAFSSDQSLTGRLLGHRALVAIGLVSYSAYLWHQPIFAFARLRAAATPTPAAMATLCAATLVLAYFSWRYVESPFRNRSTVRRGPFLASSILIGIAFVTFGYAGKKTDGFSQRSNEQQREIMGQIDALAAERQALIRADKCHFSGLTGKTFEVFLAEWDCFGDSDDRDLTPIPLVVAGDSHAADKVVALQLNGFNPLHMTGAGCSLDPGMMKKRCRELFDRLHRIVNDDDRYKYIVLANHFEEDELTLQSIKATIDYWETFDKQLIFFTGMPYFGDFRSRAVRSLPIRADIRIASQSSRDELTEYLRSRGVHVIDTLRQFCSLSQDCGYLSPRGESLVVDGGHLSRTGAKLLGMRLATEDPIFHALMRSDLLFRQQLK